MSHCYRRFEHPYINGNNLILLLHVFLLTLKQARIRIWFTLRVEPSATYDHTCCWGSVIKRLERCGWTGMGVEAKCFTSISF